MTRDELLANLRSARTEFDGLVAHVPVSRLDQAPTGFRHSPKEIVAHVTAYEELVVERLKAARRGETTEFDRDRAGWEAFNERIWKEARGMNAEHVLERAAPVFGELVDQIAQLEDKELDERVGMTAFIDPTWLGKHSLGEIIAIDTYEHYPMHFDALKAAAAAS